MAKAAQKAASRAAGGPANRSWFWAQGLACGILVATAAPLAVVLAVVFAPAALGALAAAGDQGRRLGGVMLVYGLAAALPWLGALWAASRDWGLALDLLGGMRLVGVCWSAQAAAWLLSEIVPLVARLVLEARVHARNARLREARTRLQEEWGLEPQEPNAG